MAFKSLFDVGIRWRLVALRLWSALFEVITILIFLFGWKFGLYDVLITYIGIIIGGILYVFYYLYNWAMSERDIHKGFDTSRWYDKKMYKNDFIWLLLPVIFAVIGSIVGIFISIGPL